VATLTSDFFPAAQTTTMRTIGVWLIWIAAWVWTFGAGLGGCLLILKEGPWPLTNGWYAMFSGISACPLIGWVLRKYARLPAKGWMQFAAALAFFVVGRIALLM
jgi:hypothetical protein